MSVRQTLKCFLEIGMCWENILKKENANDKNMYKRRQEQTYFLWKKVYNQNRSFSSGFVCLLVRHIAEFEHFFSCKIVENTGYMWM